MLVFITSVQMENLVHILRHVVKNVPLVVFDMIDYLEWFIQF